MLRFFIDRPIFASVISIIIVLAGLAAIRVLPVEQYPDVVPPQISVQASYPGASAQAIADSVAAPLEQEINGVDDMIYMESTNTDSGSMSLTVTFEIGTDPDQATINVNNRVQSAMSRLPQSVRDQGVRVEARSSSILMVPVLFSPEGTYDPLYISNYALLNVLDELVRLPGVGDASLFGAQDYSMRIWLRPDKLAQFDMTPGDVAAALREQNAQFSAGLMGAEPAPEDQVFTYSITTEGLLQDPEEFENIILRSNDDGSVLRLGDVAHAELGAQNYSFSATYNGQAAVPIGIYLQPGANALETAESVQSLLTDLESRFPEDLDYSVPYDTTEFVEASVEEVVTTLLIALGLVTLVTFLFVQRLRATLIPVIAIPISLIGTFAGMLLLGFSINLLTLFGLVLAIGIVVDDAIVVLENVDRLIKEEGMTAHDAAVATMKQVAGAVIAATLTLISVFAPVAFLGGMTGELYRQFAVTIAVSVMFSGIVALTLAPALSALLLGKEDSGKESWFFRYFNSGFQKISNGYANTVQWFLRHAVLGILVFVVVIGSVAFLINRLPPGLVPQEDQGVALVAYQLPAVSALGRTEAVRDKVSKMLLSMEEIEDYTTFAGYDIIASSQRTSAGVGFANLTDWDERQGPGQDAQSVAGKIMGAGAQVPEATVISFLPPPIMGLSLTGGVEGYLQVRGDSTPEEIRVLGNKLAAAANQRPELTNVRTTLNTDIPRYKAKVDREKAKAAGVPINSIFQAMQSTFGAMYINDFTFQGRNWQVNLQSEGEFRSKPEDLRRVFVRSEEGNMIPLSSLVDLERKPGPDIINRFNVYSAAKMMADAAPGYTTGQAKNAMEEVAAGILTPQSQLGWTGEAYQLDAAAGSGQLAFLMGMVMVFLILSAKYERWALPIAVLTAVPFGILGAALAVFLSGLPNDVYFQVGLLVLIGLSAKNAILIVEFADQHRKEGMATMDAAMAAVRQRFRAIIMTSLTFIIGTMPLVFSTGAGAASRVEIGTVVVGGMIAASSLALIFVPLFYKLIVDGSDRLRGRHKQTGSKEGQTENA